MKMKNLSLFNLFILVSLSALLSACGGGADTVALPDTGTDGGDVVNYTGPPPNNLDVQNFKTNLWDNLVADNRCGECHGLDGQAPTFVRDDDINLAYEAANTVVNLNSPADSIIVTKVGGGHNCWLTSDAACADTLTAYITAWAGGTTDSSNSIDLAPPQIRDPGASKAFPEDSTLFSTTVYPLLTTYCSECHSETAEFAQRPFFAAADVDVAYEAAKAKIDLDTPVNSRLSARLTNEFHNCWSDCTNDGATMLAAITNFADGITPTQVDPTFITSKAMRLTDGIISSSGGRSEANVIARYEFKTGEGVTAFDTSGIEPALNLNFTGDVTWVGGWGVRITDGKIQGTTAASKKLHDLIKQTGEYAVEAWVAPNNVTQDGPARIISYSAGTQARNFTLGQTLYNYDFLHRSSTTDGNGEPGVSTPDAAEILQATLQHVVVTFDAVNGRRIFVNGELVGEADSVAPGSIADWDDTFALVMGNEVSSDRLWEGVIRFVAIHNRALTPEQVRQNFDVGVGEKFYLLFSVSHLVDVPESYIVFEVSQFDSYSYLFNEPFYITLDATARPSNVPLRNIRIGVNGKLANVGQAFSKVDITLDASSYGESGQVISPLGTVIGLERGPEADDFFLSFERIGNNENVIVEANPPTPGTPADLPAVPDIGLKIFAELNASMSRATTVPSTQTNVATTYETIKQQLPSTENINGFLSAQQMAVTQLAIAYCNALVEDTTLRAAYFPGFNFSTSAETAFDAAGKALVINPLIANIVGTNVASQPDTADIETEIGALIDRLATCTGACPATRTATIVKASCAAILGSAVILVQ